MAHPTAPDLTTAAAELRVLPKSQELARAAANLVLEHARPPQPDGTDDDGLAAKILEDAALDRGDLEPPQIAALDSIDRGPEDAKSAALADALVALGIQARLESARTPEARRQVVDGFLDQLDWLEVSSPLAPYAALAALLEQSVGDVFWKAVVSALARDARAEQPEGSRIAARRRVLLVTRAAALVHAPSALKPQLTASVHAQIDGGELKRIALASLAGDDVASDETNEADAAVETRRVSTAAQAPKLEGELEGRSWGLVARLLAAVTGVLLLRWLLRLAARYLLGLRHEASVDLKPTTLVVDGQVHLLGRVIREAHATRSLAALREATITRRFRYLHMIIGAVALVVGAALGINFLVEGALSSYPPLALFGLAVIAGGIALDVVLEVLVPNRKGVCSLTLDFGRRHTFQLRGVDQKAAERFVEDVTKLLPAPRGAKPAQSK